MLMGEPATAADADAVELINVNSHSLGVVGDPRADRRQRQRDR